MIYDNNNIIILILVVLLVMFIKSTNVDNFENEYVINASKFNLVQFGNTWMIWSATSVSSWDIFNGATIATTSLSLNTWHHIAMVRNGSTFTLYVNGTSAGTLTSSGNIWSTLSRNLYLFGKWQTSGGANGLNGYVDDYRITKGYARYTANFTPPSSALITK